jgi:hypothetical protein
MTRTNGWLDAAFEMTTPCVVLATTLIAACSSANPDQFVRPMAPIVALAHVRVIDGTGAPGKDDQTVIIEGGRIFALGDAMTLNVPTGAHTLDLDERTVIPGLVGLHEHLFYGLEPGCAPKDGRTIVVVVGRVAPGNGIRAGLRQRRRDAPGGRRSDRVGVVPGATAASVGITSTHPNSKCLHLVSATFARSKAACPEAMTTSCSST